MHTRTPPPCGRSLWSPPPGPRCSEVPAAFGELHVGAAVTAEQLQEHCAGVLARFTVPRHVRFVTEWPMSATTIQRGPLRERIAAELVDGKEHA